MKDISKATNQQLYTIARDSSERLRDRYEAARELQKRKVKKRMANPVCPKCDTEGHIISMRHANNLKIECPSCKHIWKSESEVCPSCYKSNGYAVPGLCIKCYEETRP
ncbi:hypothetical protein M3175_01405 [Robertmurraya korlensis]|nr:hypothetical protein [Robertmurraya korlensis]